MSFSPTITHDSKTAPGTRFTVHRMGFGRRTDFDFQTLTHRQRLRELETDYPPPSDKEKEITEALEIAKRKALAVPADQFESVIENDVKPLGVELAAAVPAETRKRRAVIDEEYQMIDARIRTQWVLSGLIAIAGGDADGMTAEQLLAYGPPELALEIYEALTSDGRLKETERKNSPSPNTSSEAAGGPTASSTAPSASIPQADTTTAATASNISQAA